MAGEIWFVVEMTCPCSILLFFLPQHISRLSFVYDLLQKFCLCYIAFFAKIMFENMCIKCIWREPLYLPQYVCTDQLLSGGELVPYKSSTKHNEGRISKHNRTKAGGKNPQGNTFQKLYFHHLNQWTWI